VQRDLRPIEHGHRRGGGVSGEQVAYRFSISAA
jgi:hypothetical protein